MPLTSGLQLGSTSLADTRRLQGEKERAGHSSCRRPLCQNAICQLWLCIKDPALVRQSSSQLISPDSRNFPVYSPFHLGTAKVPVAVAMPGVLYHQVAVATSGVLYHASSVSLMPTQPNTTAPLGILRVLYQ